MRSMQLSIFTMLMMLTVSQTIGQPLTYPATRTVDVADTMHGVVVKDPYRWLEDDHDSEVVAWVAAQQKVADAYLARIPYRSKLTARVKEVYNYKSVSSPWQRGNYTFYYVNNGLQNHSVLMVRDKRTEKERVLIDPNTFSVDGTVALAFASESTDGMYMAFGKTQAGSDWRSVYVLDIATGKLLTDELRGIKNGGVSWYKGGFFYDRYDMDETKELSLTARNEGEYTCYHVIGTEQQADVVAYRDATRPTVSVGMWVPERCPYLIRYESDEGSRGNRIYIKYIGDQGAWDGPGDYKKIYDNADNGYWPSIFHDGMLYGTTTLEAKNQRVVRIVDLDGSATMETVIPETRQPISSVAWGGGRIFVTRMVDVHDHVTVYDLEGKEQATVELPSAGNVGGFGGEPEDTILYYQYSSFLTPTTIYEYHVATNTSSVYYQVQPPFDPSAFEEHQVWVTSKDGTRLPMFVLYKKGMQFNRKAPTMVFGYGGFGITYGPSFTPSYIPWLEQGCVVAIPNLRGGGEYGEEWHEAGMKERKQNVFDDCIASAEWLIQNGITSPVYLALNGRSNGGLLVGAVMLQRPDLFRVAVPEVGVLDMLRFHLFTVGRYWTTDYGSIEREDEFKALLAYSPYHNIKGGVEYPSTMVMTSDHDDRVVPAHSFKFAAALQATYTGTRPMILRVETKSGHGAVNRQKAFDNITDKYAFIWYEMGFHPKY